MLEFRDHLSNIFAIGDERVIARGKSGEGRIHLKQRYLREDTIHDKINSMEFVAEEEFVLSKEGRDGIERAGGLGEQFIFRIKRRSSASHLADDTLSSNHWDDKRQWEWNFTKNQLFELLPRRRVDPAIIYDQWRHCLLQ